MLRTVWIALAFIGLSQSVVHAKESCSELHATYSELWDFITQTAAKSPNVTKAAIPCATEKDEKACIQTNCQSYPSENCEKMSAAVLGIFKQGEDAKKAAEAMGCPIP